MFNNDWDYVITDAYLATMVDEGFGSIEDGALGIKDGRFVFVGHRQSIPDHIKVKQHKTAHGKVITPGLIDCHTHLVYAGNRALEFELRLQGMSYQQIAAQGGGILSTVKATRKADEKVLQELALNRLSQLINQGVTTVEIKSGYGLTVEDEIKLLTVARQLAKLAQINVFNTFLGAHTIPIEYQGRADAYLALVCSTMLPKAQALGLVDAVDIFCETMAFSLDQCDRFFRTAQSLKLPIKIHAEQLSNSGGAILASEYQALSADHLEFADQAAVKAMARSGTIAVLLPGAFYFLRQSQKPPIELFRQYGVPLAIATDHNPGSSPCYSLLLMLNMACTLFGLTPQEALNGVTRVAAKALGLPNIGQLSVGFNADFVIWDIKHPSELAYAIGNNPCLSVFHDGQEILTR